MICRLLCTLCAASLTIAQMMTVRAEDKAPPVGYAPQSDSLEAGLWQQASDVENNIQQSPLLVRDEALNSYVRQLVCKLAETHCASLRVFIVEIPVANAGCYPNGMVLVHTGLLLRVDSEAQLAFVLGHELTHYLKRHVLNRRESARDLQDVFAFLTLGVAGVTRFSANVNLVQGVRAGYDVARLVAYGSFFAYTRNQERESDEGGFERAVKLGYDPRQGVALWSRMEAEEAADPDRRYPDPFFATHPTNKDRIKALAALAESAASGTHAVDIGADRYRTAIKSHRATWLTTELNRGAYERSIFLVTQLIAAEPDSGELHFFLGESYRRRNAKGDLQRALDAYNAALARPDAPPALHRSIGVVNMKSGNAGAARDAFRKYLSVAPSADDREMIETYISQLEG